MSAFPGIYAVPGAMMPGAAWPGEPVTAGSAGGAAHLFALGVPYTAGGGMGYGISMSQLATMYYLVPVAATQAGVTYNPTNDTVQFAFMPQATQVPGTSDWVSGSWETNTSSVLYPYNAKCLIGPSGTVTLGIGTYVVYLKILDNPETPVLIAGQLQVT